MSVDAPATRLPFGRRRDADPNAVRYRRTSTGGLLANLALVLVGIAFLLPLLWLLLASVDAHAGWAIRLPDLTTANYRQALAHGGWRPLLNSFYLASVASVVATCLALLAGYPLSRRHVPGKRLFMLGILFLSGLPVTMMLVPIYQLFVKLNWLDSIFYMGLFLAATALPFAIWLVKNFIDAIPVEFEEAAAIEGAGTVRTMVSVVLPLSLPGLAVTLIYTFIAAWGAFVVPLVLDQNPGQQMGTVALYQFLGSHGLIQFGPLAAFSILFSIPVVILYLLVSRSLSGAFTFGGGVRG
jgi:multiple sugar transport system permease protein